MGRNAQAIILIVASQISWAFCCLASSPAFIATTYDETPFQWFLMLNGFLIVSASSVLLVLGALVAAGKKKDPLSAGGVDPKFKIGMGVTAMMLGLQLALAVGHAAWQPAEEEIVAPQIADAPTFRFTATLDDGQTTGGVNGFVITHPESGEPVFVTVSQQFSRNYGLEADLAVTEVARRVESAAVSPIRGASDDTVRLGRPIPFQADAIFASGYGVRDSMSDVLFFEAPAQLGDDRRPVKIFDGLESAPRDQKLFIRSADGGSFITAKFDTDAEDLWTANVEPGTDLVPGTPVVDWQQQVVGFVTMVSEDGEVEIFPLHLAFDYLGSPTL